MQSIYGPACQFPEGSYAGTLEEVRRTITRFGRIDVCTFVKGWLEDTLPGFHDPVAVAFIDVDLVSSTRTALKHLWPLVAPGGSAFSHEGSLAEVRAVLVDDAFWLDEVGSPRPTMYGVGRSRLVQMQK